MQGLQSINVCGSRCFAGTTRALVIRYLADVDCWLDDVDPTCPTPGNARECPQARLGSRVRLARLTRQKMLHPGYRAVVSCRKDHRTPS